MVSHLIAFGVISHKCFPIFATFGRDMVKLASALRYVSCELDWQPKICAETVVTLGGVAILAFGGAIAID